MFLVNFLLAYGIQLELIAAGKKGAWKMKTETSREIP
jgi:hypothetical protein